MTKGLKTFYFNYSGFEPKDIEIIRKDLQSPNDSHKIEAMKELLLSSDVDSTKADILLMDVIKYIMPTYNKKLKKFCLLYLENVEKHDGNGNMKHEMILVW